MIPHYFKLLDCKIHEIEYATPYDLGHISRLNDIEAVPYSESLLKDLLKQSTIPYPCRIVEYEIERLNKEYIERQRQRDFQLLHCHNEPWIIEQLKAHPLIHPGLEVIRYELYKNYLKTEYPMPHEFIYENPLYLLYIDKLIRVGEYYAPERMHSWIGCGEYSEILEQSHYSESPDEIEIGRCRNLDLVDLRDLRQINQWLNYDFNIAMKRGDYLLTQGMFGTMGYKITKGQGKGLTKNKEQAKARNELIKSFAIPIMNRNPNFSRNNLAKLTMKAMGDGSPSLRLVTEVIKSLQSE
ncbi:MAG: hypothetical protein WAZ18_03630 [Alphaproteobacteria bacterium]